MRCKGGAVPPQLFQPFSAATGPSSLMPVWPAALLEHPGPPAFARPARVLEVPGYGGTKVHPGLSSIINASHSGSDGLHMETGQGVLGRPQGRRATMQPLDQKWFSGPTWVAQPEREVAEAPQKPELARASCCSHGGVWIHHCCPGVRPPSTAP